MIVRISLYKPKIAKTHLAEIAFDIRYHHAGGKTSNQTFEVSSLYSLIPRPSTVLLAGCSAAYPNLRYINIEEKLAFYK